MTTPKNTSIGIALLGIFIIISSFGNEVSARESDQLFLHPYEFSDTKVNESGGAVQHDAAIDKVHIASYDRNDKLITYSVQRQWIYGRNKQPAGRQFDEIDSGTSLRLQEDKDTYMLATMIPQTRCPMATRSTRLSHPIVAVISIGIYQPSRNFTR